MFDSLFSKLKGAYFLGKNALKTVRNLGGKALRHARSETGQNIINTVNQFIPGAKTLADKIISHGSNFVHQLNRADQFLSQGEKVYNKIKQKKVKTLERPKVINKEEDYLGYDTGGF